MKKRAWLAGLIAAALPSAGSAHLVVHVDLIAPGNTPFHLETNDAVRDGRMPAGSGLVYLDYSVLGYYEHSGRQTVTTSFTATNGSVIQCLPQTAGVYEPAWHYQLTCKPTFRFNGSACTSSCEVVPVTPPDPSAQPKAFPNPMRSSHADAVQMINLPPNARVKIYGPTGRVVYEKTIGIEGTLHWHTDDLSGRMVGTGVYHVVAQGEDKTVTLNVAVQR